MILYDKSGMFLGMGTQELSLLGYEDMEEFKNYHNDIADLFINKPGYIFKFKNFSWIDYTLHSGTPNRRVLIKTKNGREVDSALHIHEIFLTHDIYNAKSCFGVEFVSATPFAKTEIPRVVSAQQETTVESFEPHSAKEAPTAFMMEDAPVSAEAFEEAPVSSEASYTFDNTFEIKSPTTIEEPIPSLNDVKLKFDSDILNEPSVLIKSPSIQTEDTFLPNIPLFMEESSRETYPEDAHEDLLKDSLLSIKEPLPTPFEEKEEQAQEKKIEMPTTLFDFSLSAEALGLDISTLAEIITEYVEELDSKIPHIIKALESQQFSYVKEEITKLKSVALHLHIIPLYDALASLEGQLDAAAMPSLLPIQNVISDLKDSLQC